MTPAVGTIPSASQTVAGKQERGKLDWRRSNGESRSEGRLET